jgi:hypothetical protein
MRKLSVGRSSDRRVGALAVSLPALGVHLPPTERRDTYRRVALRSIRRSRIRRTLRTGDRCDERVLAVYGDQWRVDAEFLNGSTGAVARSRLAVPPDRLEGRYRSVVDQNSQPKVAHDLRDETAVDVVSLAEGLGRWNFLIDASYGSSTYQDIDPANVYDVYRTQTAIITRSKPRPVPEQGAPIAVDVDRACGAPQPVWYRVTTWTDERAKEALAYVQTK